MRLKSTLQIEIIKLTNWSFLIAIMCYVVIMGLYMTSFFDVAHLHDEYTRLGLQLILQGVLKQALTAYVPIFTTVLLFLLLSGKELNNKIIKTYLANGITKADFFFSKLVAATLYVFIFENIRLLVCIAYAYFYFDIGIIEFYRVFSFETLANSLVVNTLFMSIGFCALFFTRNAAFSIVVFIGVFVLERSLLHQLPFKNHELLLPMTFLQLRFNNNDLNMYSNFAFMGWIAVLWGASFVWFYKRDV